MQQRKGLISFLFIIALLTAPVRSYAQTTFGGSLYAQTGAAAGTLSGTVTLVESGKPIHNVLVTIVQLKRTEGTDDNGKYTFTNVPAGKYDVIAHLDRVPDVVQQVDVPASGAATLDFQIQLGGLSEQVTVTATGTELAVSSSIQSVNVIGSLELARKNTSSLGEVLDQELGVSKRSFGPATARPVIRGFDGDRVLVLEDGDRIGALGFQSGDHAEPIDVLSLEKIEVVKGPSTLLYGSSAIGGVVNAVTGHESAHKGFNAYVTGIGSTNNWTGGGSAGFEYGTNKWLFWSNGGGQKSNDYKTPIGVIPNSYSREGNYTGGTGYYPGKGFFSVNYQFDKRRYGIPFNAAEENPDIVFLNPRRHSIQFNTGFKDVQSFIEAARFSFQYNDYKHGEISADTGVVNTSFHNKTFNYRGNLDQRKEGKLTGTLGFWGLHRDYTSAGEEALAPPTKQNSFAVFGVETLDFTRAVLQFGGRVETNRYNPSPTEARGALPARDFTGFSGAVGLRVPVWEGGAFTANYSHSYRAPALEELYNRGPHGGNVTFEIGDPNLKRELGEGLDFGFRQTAGRVHGEINGFFYHLRDFIFLAPTGETDEESGLRVAEYSQGTADYRGVEAKLDVTLHKYLALDLGTDYVRADLTDTNTPIPRIPPLRGRAALDFHYKNMTLSPEVVAARDQNRLFPTETRTPGYTVFNMAGSYLIARQHYAHIFSVNAFNLGDRLYFNHLSFIKDFAPEIGRGVRFSYTLRYF
jgi:iron complex outermembrane receptor protein